MSLSASTALMAQQEDPDAHNATISLQTYPIDDIVKAGDKFFGNLSQGLAQIVERLFSQYGEPNGYILGDEAGFAVIGGVRYGNGRLYTLNAGEHPIFWQGPSIGWDFGASGSKAMFLIYNLQSIDQLYASYPGVEGSAFVVGGISVMVMSDNNVVIAPIRTGFGARIGVNVGYIKFTHTQTWNPF